MMRAGFANVRPVLQRMSSAFIPTAETGMGIPPCRTLFVRREEDQNDVCRVSWKNRGGPWLLAPANGTSTGRDGAHL